MKAYCNQEGISFFDLSEHIYKEFSEAYNEELIKWNLVNQQMKDNWSDMYLQQGDGIHPAENGRVYVASLIASWLNTVLDVDSDGVSDAHDNCLTLSNPGQEDGDGDDVDKPSSLSFKLFPLQKKNVDTALEKAQEISGSDKSGNLLDLICTDYLATNAGVDSVQDMLRKQEKNLGVRLVAYDEEHKSVIYGSDLIRELEEEDASETVEGEGSEQEGESE